MIEAMSRFPADWYWCADDGRVYSSLSQTLIGSDDPGLMAFTERFQPTRWPSDDAGQQTDAALLDVLTPYGLSIYGTSLDVARAARTRELYAACERRITGGFSSSALGTPHAYPSTMVDQINLMGSVSASLLPDRPADWTTPFWCASDGAWAFRPHDAAQIQAAGADCKAHVAACQTLLAALNLQVQGASSVAAVEAITWPESL